MRAPQNSNHDYTSCALGRDRKQDRFGTIGGAKIPFEARGGEEAQGGSSTEVGPGVRIRFPPGESPLRTWTADDSGVLGHGRWETEPSAVSCSFAGRGPLRWNRPVRGMFGSGKPAMTASNRDQRWYPPA